jgi:CO dehydrogenase maturation factor
LTLSIAVAGKGGSGKTSVTALIIRYLDKHNMCPILAVDADPNANLADSLGLKVDGTVGQILDTFQKEKINIPPGMTKEAYLEYKLNEVIVEGKSIDLITMGRGEGPECYCYPNVILRKMIDTLSGNYKVVVMDNEAGMEHLSRRTSSNVDELLIVSNHTVKGVRTIAQIQKLIADLNLSVRRQWIVLNAVPATIDPRVKEELDRLGIKPAVTVPYDEELLHYDLSLKPLLEMPDSSEAVKAIDSMMNNLFQ